MKIDFTGQISVKTVTVVFKTIIEMYSVMTKLQNSGTIITIYMFM